MVERKEITITEKESGVDFRLARSGTKKRLSIQELKTSSKRSFNKRQKKEHEQQKTLMPGKPKVAVKPETSIKVEQRFDKAFAVSLGLIALLSLLFFIPILGPVMGLSLAPYFACNRGCRYINSKNGMQLGVLLGMLWSIIELFLLFQILNFVKIAVTPPGIHTLVDVVIIISVFLANIIFCVIGGYTGGVKFEEASVDTKTGSNQIKELPM